MPNGTVPTGSPTNLGGRGVYNLGGGEFRRCGDLTSPAYGPQPGGGHVAKINPIRMLTPGDPGFVGRPQQAEQSGQPGLGSVFNLLDMLKGIINLPFQLLGGPGKDAGGTPSKNTGVVPSRAGGAAWGDPEAVRAMDRGEPPLWQRMG